MNGSSVQHSTQQALTVENVATLPKESQNHTKDFIEKIPSALKGTVEYPEATGIVNEQPPVRGSAANGACGGAADHLASSKDFFNKAYKLFPSLARNPANQTHAPIPDPNEDLPSIEDPAIAVANTWRPLALTRMLPLDSPTLSKIPPPSKTRTFSWPFLHSLFGGLEWTPDLYYIPPSHGKCILPSRTFYAVQDPAHDPYLPSHPGAHGAKLIPFLRDNDDGMSVDAFRRVPMFVARRPDEYFYYGMYTQSRWSDKLDAERMVTVVPDAVKMYWADELTQNGKSEWVTRALMRHFFPRPEYEGVVVAEVAEGSVAVEDQEQASLEKDVRRHVDELAEWEGDARVKVGLLRKEQILESFEVVRSLFIFTPNPLLSLLSASLPSFLPHFLLF